MTMTWISFWRAFFEFEWFGLMPEMGNHDRYDDLICAVLACVMSCFSDAPYFYDAQSFHRAQCFSDPLPSLARGLKDHLTNSPCFHP
jgi:hypothetical protein